MAKNKKNKNPEGGIVYSTDPEYQFADLFKEAGISSGPEKDQNLRIWLERYKGNKEATVVKGFEGSDEDLADLAKTLKSKCASGGSAKNGQIIIQGNHREKVLKLLHEMGFTNSKLAGG